MSYIYLAANPYPGFTGTPGYPIDLELPPAERQNRWATGFRIFLALPALLVASTLLSGGSFQTGSAGTSAGLTGAAGVVAFFGWFVCLARKRMPLGFRNLVAYGVGYSAQAFGYLLLVTDRYPNSDPRTFPVVDDLGPRTVRLSSSDDLVRSRLTVFFRLLLALPHFVWLTLWAIVALLVALINGIATLIAGRSPTPLHRFLAAFVRYEIHVFSYASLMANPFPGFLGRPGAYPVDVEIDYAEHQNRWITAFRIFLALPAVVIGGALGGALFVAAFLGWFFSLFRARMPTGLRSLGAYALRYAAELYSYVNVLTDSYPYTGPTVHGPPPSREPVPSPAPSEG
jgi:hypothetical protein